MLVSFIIIAYNAEKFLDKSLESLKKQDYPHKDIEVILVDSISTDGTRKVFEEFKKENEKDFKETIGNRISKIMKVSYVFQELTNFLTKILFGTMLKRLKMEKTLLEENA